MLTVQEGLGHQALLMQLIHIDDTWQVRIDGRELVGLYCGWCQRCRGACQVNRRFQFGAVQSRVEVSIGHSRGGVADEHHIDRVRAGTVWCGGAAHINDRLGWRERPTGGIGESGADDNGRSPEEMIATIPSRHSRAKEPWIDRRTASYFSHGSDGIEHMDKAARFPRMSQVDFQIGDDSRFGNSCQQRGAVNAQSPVLIARLSGKGYALDWEDSHFESKRASIVCHSSSCWAIPGPSHHGQGL